MVTGAGSGIGRGIAMQYAREGAHVIVADMNADTARRTAEEINSRSLDGSLKAESVALDVTVEEMVDSVVDQIVDQHGRLDVLVCNAGVQHIAPVHELAYQDWKRIVNVHLDGSFLCTRAALRHMYNPRGSGQTAGGSIIYIGSVHSKTASVLKAPYVAAKHAILGLCRTVAKEGAAHNVRANVVCPGFVLTPLVEKQIPEQAQTLGISEEDVVKKIMLKGRLLLNSFERFRTFFGIGRCDDDVDLTNRFGYNGQTPSTVSLPLLRTWLRCAQRLPGSSPMP